MIGSRKIRLMERKRMKRLCEVHEKEMVLVRDYLHLSLRGAECQYHWECPECCRGQRGSIRDWPDSERSERAS